MDGWMNGLVDDFMTKSFSWIKKNCLWYPNSHPHPGIHTSKSNLIFNIHQLQNNAFLGVHAVFSFIKNN